mgnify:CR=1 FL=1
MTKHPHRRMNPLTGEWVLISPHRAERPWLGQVEKLPLEELPKHDPDCYLCPGSERAGGAVNPDYLSTYVFTNDFSALLPESEELDQHQHDLFQHQPINGTCRVICFSPRHDLTLPEMKEFEIRQVVDTWVEETRTLGEMYPWVQVFENKGKMMGCSNPHPHGQIWASSQIPVEPKKEDHQQRKYFQQNGIPLLVDYLQEELKQDQRVVIQNEHWAVLVPYWAVWPFETLLLPKFEIQRLTDLNGSQSNDLSEILKQLLTRYDNLFETRFSYSMGWHGAPFDGKKSDHWLLHAHFYPPLLRSATVKKFMVGYEMLAEPQRDITAESAAARLREVPAAHYRSREDSN